MSITFESRKRKRSPSPEGRRRFDNKSRRTSGPSDLNYEQYRDREVKYEGRHLQRKNSLPNSPQTQKSRKYENPLSSETKLVSIYDYKCSDVLAEGSFGMVYAGYKDGKKFAIKKLKLNDQERSRGIYKREIQCLHQMKHDNIVRLHEVATNKRNQLFLVFDYHDCDLKRLLVETPTLPESFVKNLMLQFYEGLKYIHGLHYCHRDLKPANLLLNLEDGLLRIADFGSVFSTKEISRRTPNQVTLWYRAPEILFGSRSYDASIDIWSSGCVFVELLTGKPLFNAQTEIEQIHKIINTLGTPSKSNWPGFESLPLAKNMIFRQQKNILRTQLPNISENAYNLLLKLLRYEPTTRISAEEASQQEYFHTCPLPDRRGSVPDLRVVYSSPLAGVFQ